jgi:hypothetical protein
MYINDLATELNEIDGLKFGDINISVLLYADDIVLISDTEQKLQNMITHVCKWCSKWRLDCNIEKTNTVHYRPVGRKRTEFKFVFNNSEISTVKQYKYLGILFDEHLNFKPATTVLYRSKRQSIKWYYFEISFTKKYRL